METLRIALVHDWLTGQRGGEKVLEVFAELFPEAPIYTLIHIEGSQIKSIEDADIRTSFLQKMPLVKTKYRSYLPLFPLAVEQFDLQDFDLVLSSSHCVAKGIVPRPDALHIAYVHSPMRYAWNHYFSYFGPRRIGFFSRLVIPPVIHHLRIWDESSSRRVDHFIANSRTVAARIRKYYSRSAEVIFPPVDTDFFQPGGDQGDYFLIVSALVPYKRIELAVEAFNRSGLPLRIVGTGPEYRRLKKRAKPNVSFLGSLKSGLLLETYQKARAMIMPGEEDFGINAVESQACGVPVIAFGRGGATETVIPEKTGLFFSEPAASSLLEVLDKFESFTFNKTTVRTHALKYSKPAFKKNISAFIQEKWTEHTETT
jgi:glycosyltransferase involved in cell wall biosynthesis